VNVPGTELSTALGRNKLSRYVQGYLKKPKSNLPINSDRLKETLRNEETYLTRVKIKEPEGPENEIHKSKVDSFLKNSCVEWLFSIFLLSFYVNTVPR